MDVQSLSLGEFRNIPTLDWTPGAGRNLLIGDNGQGKTNLLEALYFLSHARSPRTSVERELIRLRPQPLLDEGGEALLMPTPTRITATVHRKAIEGETRLEAQLLAGGERMKTRFLVNGQPVASRSKFLGYLPTVSFFASDLLMLRGAPEDRRQWLDRALVQYEPGHFQRLSAYHRIRQQKNRLLKDALQNGQPLDSTHLESWNVQLAEAGGALTASRLAYLQRLETLLPLRHLDIAPEEPALSLQYESAWLGEVPTAFPDEAALAEQLFSAIRKATPEELRRGTSAVGPHRDDIAFALGDKDVRAYGSQGQQRSVVLAAKLVELSLLESRLGEAPVLLLDDVMAELDPGRQRHLVAAMAPGCQVFLATTHLEGSRQDSVARFVADAEDTAVQLYQVSAGTLSPLSRRVLL